MTPLRQRMLDDMQIRHGSPDTHGAGHLPPLRRGLSARGRSRALDGPAARHDRDRVVPHRRARWPCRAVSPLRAHSYKRMTGEQGPFPFERPSFTCSTVGIVTCQRRYRTGGGVSTGCVRVAWSLEPMLYSPDSGGA